MTAIRFQEFLAYTQGARNTAMNTASELTPFQIRVCALEEGTSGILRLPPFQTTGVAALARLDRTAGTSELAWIPLQDGLRLGLPEAEHQHLRGRLYEIAANKLGRVAASLCDATDEVPMIDVALPCLDKRMSQNREDHWITVDGAPEYGGFAQAIAAGWLTTVRGETELPPMEWTFEAKMNGAAAKAILPPLLESYRAAEEELPQWPLDGSYNVHFQVSLTGMAAGGWYQLGSERTYEFFRSLSRVSTAAQAAIRRWLPVLWLNDGRMFDRPREAAALLAYSSLPPMLARSRRNYTYDPLDTESLKQALVHCGRKIQRQLQNWYPSLAAMKHVAAEQFHPRWHSRWAAEFTRHSKRIRTLLANEAWLIDQLVNFAAEFQPHASVSELTGTIRRARAMHATLDARFRRWWDGRQAHNLIGLILLEATSAFSTAPVNLTVTLKRVEANSGPAAPIILRASRGACTREDAPRSSEAAWSSVRPISLSPV